MKEIIIIAAISENSTIGKDNKIPWHYKEDFQHFKDLTLNHPVIMGRKTWESLPIKPLPKRKNIILTRNKDYVAEDVFLANSIESALNLCPDESKIYIIGGQNIYQTFMELANKLEITRIHKTIEGDTFFPEIDLNKWKIIKQEDKGKFSFVTYIKKN